MANKSKAIRITQIQRVMVRTYSRKSIDALEVRVSESQVKISRSKSVLRVFRCIGSTKNLK